MAAIINTNLQSLNAQRNLSSSQSSLATSMQRLSSGLRINSAKDDAAGLAISERMSTQVRGLTVAARNANDGISLAQTAEGALGSVGNNLQRIRELAVQARNATNSSDDRAALNAEVQQLKAEVTRIAQQTSFNGTKLLDGSFTDMAFQVGANAGQTIDIKNIANANVESLGSWDSVPVPSKLTGAAVAGSTSAVIIPGTGSFPLAAPTGVTPNIGYADFDIEVNGVTATISAGLTHSNAGDAHEALRAALETAIPGTTLTLDGTNKIAVSNGGLINIAVVPPASSPLGSAALTVAAGKNVALGGMEQAKVEINGKAFTLPPQESASQRLNDLVTQINGADFSPGTPVKASIINGALSLTAGAGNVQIAAVAPDDENDVLASTGLSVGSTIEGNTDFLAGSRTFVAAQQGVTGFESLNVLDAEFADNAILAMDAALTAINGARANLGAVQSRFETTVSNLSVTTENLSAARSRIMDADFAVETANLSRSQILQQAGTAMVAQANQLPQQVLQLLQG